MKTICAAIAAAGLFASTAAMAGPAEREPVKINVSTAGLDLTTQQGVDQARTRIDRAIAAACNPGDRVGADLSPDYRCRREMAANATPTLTRLAQGVVTSRFVTD